MSQRGLSSSPSRRMGGRFSGRRASHLVADFCRSRSSRLTDSPCTASQPAKLMESVVLPAPPFGFATRIAFIRASPVPPTALTFPFDLRDIAHRAKCRARGHGGVGTQRG